MLFDKRFIALIIFTLGLLLLMSVALQAQDNSEWTVCGRLVDKNGTPISKGVIYPGGDKERNWSHIVDGVLTEQSGRFCLHLISHTKPKPFRLYAESEYPAGALKLIGPPYSELPDNLRLNFSGPRVAFINSSFVEVKDFIPKTTYKILKLAVQKNDGSPAFKSRDEWKNLWIQLLDRHGALLYGVMLSNDDIISKYVDTDSSQIRLALPAGRWRIQVSTNIRFTDKNKYGISGTFSEIAVTVNSRTKNLTTHRIKIKGEVMSN